MYTPISLIVCYYCWFITNRHIFCLTAHLRQILSGYPLLDFTLSWEPTQQTMGKLWGYILAVYTNTLSVNMPTHKLITYFSLHSLITTTSTVKVTAASFICKLLYGFCHLRLKYVVIGISRYCWSDWTAFRVESGLLWHDLSHDRFVEFTNYKYEYI